MKIVVTGSLGHISKPLVQELVRNKHAVTVISSKAERIKDIEAIGANAAVGTMKDAEFLANTFKGADVVYAMETLGEGAFFDHDVDVVREIIDIGDCYFESIRQSGVKRVIHLSSIGAHTAKGNGLLAFHYHVEQKFHQLPSDVAIKFMRPVGFYYNMFAFIPTIKSRNMIVQNYGGDEKEPWVSTNDIASVIAEEIERPFDGRTVRYIASDEVSPNEVASTLGNAIGQPDLKWVAVPDEDMVKGMIAIGMNPQTARLVVEMNASRRGGVLYEDYMRNKPALSKTKLVDFAKEFAVVYDQK